MPPSDRPRGARRFLEAHYETAGDSSRCGRVSTLRMEAAALLGGAKIIVRAPCEACACSRELGSSNAEKKDQTMTREWVAQVAPWYPLRWAQ
ncbi:hypothetical protein NDU88_001592 [Pleurodeles waltl]|uniref:Uncharacterized protein n=1 Tax=Pleurodeles waltl TaxID=8319 RepID=A0AAV7P5Z8_PLEWA|nr:hypothetical protein NDU88_001592 [Pleurodeles waltl]